MKGLQLLATGGALPGRVVTNEDLSRQVDTSDEWITTRTGIRQRYYCTESEDAATLAIAAARPWRVAGWQQARLPAALRQRFRLQRLPPALPAVCRRPWGCRRTGPLLM
jgi:hypothetical protein